MAKQIKETAAEIVDEFESSISGVEYYGGMILPSEMLAFVSACISQNITLVLESGRRFGYSTEVLAAYPWQTISYDNRPDKNRDNEIKHKYPKTILLQGMGQNVFPKRVAAMYGSNRIAALCDGPKGAAAYKTMMECRYGLAFCAIHDACVNSVSRTLITCGQSNRFFTDDDEYLNDFGFLDKHVLSRIVKQSHKSYFKTGGVFGMFTGKQWTA